MNQTIPLENQLSIHLPTSEQPLFLGPDQQNLVRVKRDDQIHPIISGNKWRKVKHHLLYAQQHKIKHIISFGGGFSNHIHALGFCCWQLNIRFTAIIRGNYQLNPSPMLSDIANWQAEIRYVNKVTYKNRDSSLKQQLHLEYPGALIIPEGGSSQLALKGVEQIIAELSHPYDLIVAPVASGATLAGIISGVEKQGLAARTRVMGIAALKGQDYLEKSVSDLLPKEANCVDWQINHDYHFGGYAKKNSELVKFCQTFSQTHNLAIEPVYSGKLFYALNTLLNQGAFANGSRILALHTGGLQGAR